MTVLLPRRDGASLSSAVISVSEGDWDAHGEPSESAPADRCREVAPVTALLAHRLARGEIGPDDYRQHVDGLNHRPNE